MDLNPLQNQYLISVKRPGLWVLSIAAVLLVLILAMWMSYDRGRMAGGYDSMEANSNITELEKELRSLQAEMVDLQRTNTALERNNHIEKDANRQVKETLVKLQDEILKLNEEVSFYRSLVSPEKSKHRLHIQDLQFTKRTDKEFSYRIVVTQKGKNNIVVRGNMHIYLNGQRNGKDEKINLSRLIKEGQTLFKLGFKYFQRFEGVIELPEGFKPLSVRIQVVPSSSRLVRIDETKDWATITSEGESINVGEQKRQVGQS